LTVNQHRDYYEKIEDYLCDLEHRECPPDISDQQRKDIVNSDTLVELQFYPDTPIGSYLFVGHDVDSVLEEAVEFLLSRDSKGQR
jgi:hypothetical protein